MASRSYQKKQKPAARGRRSPRKPALDRGGKPKTATSVSDTPVHRTVVAAPSELLAGLVEDVSSSADRAIEEICAAARCLDRAGHDDGAQFILYALGKIDSIRMTAAELRGVLRREVKAEVQP